MSPRHVRPAGTGDEAVLRQLVAAHAHGLRSYLTRLERDPRDVEEVLADVFFLAHAHLDALVGLDDLQVRSWLFRSAKLLNANRSRGKRRRRVLLERWSREEGFEPPGDDPFDTIEDTIDGPPDRDRVAAVMASLHAGHREVLVLDSLGRTGPEIGAALGISPSAARKRLMHARVAFRSAWAAALPEPDVTPPDGHRSTERSRP